MLEALVLAAGALVTLYCAFVGALVLMGRRKRARAWAGFVPDCVILFKRILSDRRLPTRHRLLVGVLIAYLAMPFDLIPDFIPVAGQLDDLLFVAFVLRTVLRRGGPSLIEEHWPGPEVSLRLMLRLAGRQASKRGGPPLA